MHIKTKMKVERAEAVLSPLDVTEAIAEHIRKTEGPMWDGWVVLPKNVQMDDEGGATVLLEREDQPTATATFEDESA